MAEVFRGAGIIGTVYLVFGTSFLFLAFIDGFFFMFLAGETLRNVFSFLFFFIREFYVG